MNYAIIGGGFFGLYLAHYLSLGGGHVRVFEKENSLMSHASYNNQARVHNGYHYPRSVLTALRSRVSFPRFIKEFPDCIYSDFDKYYMIGQPLGKVTAKQFYQFCLRIGADIGLAPQNILNLVNKQHIEAVFSAKEFAFDAHKLLNSMLERLNSKVEISLNTEAKSIKRTEAGKLIVTYQQNGDVEQQFEVDQVFNCTYSRINALNLNSGLSLIPLKHEMTEMCLVDVPEEIKNMGITVMCGPFFSVMPFPSVTVCFTYPKYVSASPVEIFSLPNLISGLRRSLFFQSLPVASTAFTASQAAGVAPQLRVSLLSSIQRRMLSMSGSAGLTLQNAFNAVAASFTLSQLSTSQ